VTSAKVNDITARPYTSSIRCGCVLWARMNEYYFLLHSTWLVATQKFDPVLLINTTPNKWRPAKTEKDSLFQTNCVLSRKICPEIRDYPHTLSRSKLIREFTTVSKPCRTESDIIPLSQRSVLNSELTLHFSERARGSGETISCYSPG